MPIFGRQQQLVAALNLFAPTYRFPNNNQETIEKQMRETSTKIALALTRNPQ